MALTTDERDAVAAMTVMNVAYLGASILLLQFEWWFVLYLVVAVPLVLASLIGFAWLVVIARREPPRAIRRSARMAIVLTLAVFVGWIAFTVQRGLTLQWLGH